MCNTCKKTVHAIPPCSSAAGGSEEGFGQARLCSLCEGVLLYSFNCSEVLVVKPL